MVFINCIYVGVPPRVKEIPRSTYEECVQTLVQWYAVQFVYMYVNTQYFYYTLGPLLDSTHNLLCRF